MLSWASFFTSTVCWILWLENYNEPLSSLLSSSSNLKFARSVDHDRRKEEIEETRHSCLDSIVSRVTFDD
jgi:hypothetical protein